MGKEVDGFWITFLGQCSYLCTYHHCTLRSGLLRPRPPRTWRVLMVTEAMVPDFNNKFIDGERDTRWDHEQILSVTVDVWWCMYPCADGPPLPTTGCVWTCMPFVAVILSLYCTSEGLQQHYHDSFYGFQDNFNLLFCCLLRRGSPAKEKMLVCVFSLIAQKCGYDTSKYALCNLEALSEDVWWLLIHLQMDHPYP